MDNHRRKPNTIVEVALKVWLPVLYLIGLAMTFTLVKDWKMISFSTKLIYLIAILLPLHVLEEWRIPSGFHINYNLFRNSTLIDRYPMNQLTDAFTNFLAELIFILIALNGYSASILLAIMLFCLLEVVMHTLFGMQMFKKFKSEGKRTIYNPGFITMIIGFLPLFFVFAYYLFFQEGTISFLDWTYAVLELSFFLAAIIFLPEKLWSSKDTPYPFVGKYSKGYYAKFFHSDYH